jgi:hypothetical protein
MALYTALHFGLALSAKSAAEANAETESETGRLVFASLRVFDGFDFVIFAF